MSETKLYNFRLPIELMERIKVLQGDISATAFVMAALKERLDGHVMWNIEADDRRIRVELAEVAEAEAKRQLKAAQAEIEALQADAVRLKRDLAARPVMAPLAGAVISRSVQPVDPKAHHQSGPVLASAVPSVAGVATGYHPKASWNPKTKKGGGNE